MALTVAIAAACAPRSGDGAASRLTLVHQPFAGDPAVLQGLLDEFRRAHPEVELRTHLLPSASDVAHQFFLTALEGGSEGLDVFVVDVVWVAELARAGWIADLSDEIPPEELREALFPGVAEAVTPGGRTYAMPWYVDAGLLYYRTDLVGPRAPRTYAELLAAAERARAASPGVAGYVWQGRQYEGLVCVAYEAIWGHGGETVRGGRLALDTPEAAAGLGYLRRLIERGASPQWVTSATEEEARRSFHEGRAAMMRNWPYAWAEAQREGSPIRGKVDVAPLPSLSGEPGAGALGGWQLAVNARLPARRRAAAVALVKHLTSPDANVAMALAYGRNPPRRAAYRDPRLVQELPFIASLEEIVARARPRPSTPHYGALSDALQGELSAVVTGVRAPEDALRRAQRRADFLLREVEP